MNKTLLKVFSAGALILNSPGNVLELKPGHSSLSVHLLSQTKSEQPISSPAIQLEATVSLDRGDALKEAMSSALAVIPATLFVKNPYEIGENVPGKGVFNGLWAPNNRSGKSLGKIFQVFVAPEDLPSRSGGRAAKYYSAAMQEIGRIKKWHGYDGVSFSKNASSYNDTLLYTALADGITGWFMPPRELLDGRNVAGEIVCLENLCANKDVVALKDTLKDAGSVNGAFYWSCTEGMGVNTICAVNVSNDDYDFFPKEVGNQFSCRPFRVEEYAL